MRQYRKVEIWVLSRGIKRIPHLRTFLDANVVFASVWKRFWCRRPDAVAGWGFKATARRARRLAEKIGSPYVALEDGFLRSIDLGVKGAAPLALIVDDLGIYYDADNPSRLEDYIVRGAQSIEEMRQAAAKAMQLIRSYRLSKYNHAPPANDLSFVPGAISRVLVVDQTVGDMSVVLGSASEEDFRSMLQCAKSEHPEAEIWIKTHPDVLAGKKAGYLPESIFGSGNKVISQDYCAISILEQFDHVYVVSSQMGFEALMLGKPVTVFGRPWYAGWGLTDDRHPRMSQLSERRRTPRSLEQLFAAAYIQYTRYIRPSTGAPGNIFDVIDWLYRNKRFNDASRCTFVCVGMSFWKRAIVEPFLKTPSSRVRFVRELCDSDLSVLSKDSRIVLWGSRHRAVATAASRRGIPVVRVEDGFVRSSGLGSDLHAPLSLVIDDYGIYYDPFSRSRLERLLEEASLDEDARMRAARLRRTLVERRISKYNLGGSFRLDPAGFGRKVILVPGQVEDDASIVAGSPKIRRNADLLAQVRAAAPDAWLIYKPHPDVVAGNRHGGEPGVGIGLADQIAIHANISDCIAASDEVHTMTSLAGFEALLFGKVVHCYGGPFYAGWGLTVDHLQLPHRKRRLSLDELVYVALCEYPRYRLPGADGFCSIEDVIEYLADCAENRTSRCGSGWITKQWRKARQLLRVLSSSR